jgi:hypothetical protein
MRCPLTYAPHAGNHRLPPHPLFLRLAPPRAHRLWHPLPPRLPTEYRSNMAPHLALVAHLHRKLRPRPHRPLSLVLLLCKQVQGSKEVA